MPERCFPIVPTGKRRETRCDIPQFGLRAAWGREGPFHSTQGGPKVAISGPPGRSERGTWGLSLARFWFLFYPPRRRRAPGFGWKRATVPTGGATSRAVG